MSQSSATQPGVAKLESALGRGVWPDYPIANRDHMRDLVLDPQTFRVFFRTQSVCLTRIEFRLLEELLSGNSGFLNRHDLLRRVWGPQISVEVRTVDSHIVRLRRKLQRLGDQGPTIETVWGLGYRVTSIDDFSASS